MINNCAEMGLDWEKASLSAYLEALDDRLASQNSDKKRELKELEPDDRMKRFMKAHSVH